MTSRWLATRRVPLVPVGVILLLACMMPVRAQRPPDQADKEIPGRPSEDVVRREREAQAKLELNILENRVTVKQAELKVEETRLDLAQKLKSNNDDALRARVGSPINSLVSKLDVVHQEARIAAKKAEIAEASLRYDAARRRFQAGLYPLVTTDDRQAELERRLAELEGKVERLVDRVEGLGRLKAPGSP